MGDSPFCVTNTRGSTPSQTESQPHSIAQHARRHTRSPTTQKLTRILRLTEVLEAVRRGLVPTAVYTLLRSHADDPEATKAHMQRMAVATTTNTNATHLLHPHYLQHAVTLAPIDHAHNLKLLFYQP